MSTGAVLLLVATIVSAESGVARIDRGSAQGLESGDQGRVFYELIVNASTHRIDAGSASVLEVGERFAGVQASPGTVLRAGYEIEFEIPTARMSTPLPPGPAGLPMDSPPPIAADPTPPMPAGAPSSDSRVGEGLAGALSSEPDVGEGPAGAPSSEPEVGEGLAPSRTERPAVVPTALAGQSKTVLIPAGRYTIGRDLTEAEFFNQTPRFEYETGAIQIDQRPTTVEMYSEVGASPVGAEPTDYVRGVTWLEAEEYCRTMGGRLPTELEWEIAVRLPDVQSPPGLLEWTDSWYAPYPGNAHLEEDFGEGYRVLRGGPLGATFDPHARRFMAPDQRNSGVGFRCAFTEEAR